MNPETLAKWASVAEIAAAVGVILSLIFVGVQINEGNKESRAATLQSISDSNAYMIRAFVDHADVWNKVVTGAPLESGTETRKAIGLFNLLMTENQNHYHQFIAGYLDREQWNSRLRNLRPITSLPMYKIWRDSFGASGLTDEFLEVLDQAPSQADDE